MCNIQHKEEKTMITPASLVHILNADVIITKYPTRISILFFIPIDQFLRQSYYTNIHGYTII